MFGYHNVPSLLPKDVTSHILVGHKVFRNKDNIFQSLFQLGEVTLLSSGQ